MSKAPKRIRSLRHWKQQFSKNAQFVWRRDTVYGGKTYKAGSILPKSLKLAPTKLRRFWESQRIELAEFAEPNVSTGQTEAPKEEAYVPDLTEAGDVIIGQDADGNDITVEIDLDDDGDLVYTSHDVGIDENGEPVLTLIDLDDEGDQDEEPAAEATETSDDDNDDFLD